MNTIYEILIDNWDPNFPQMDTLNDSELEVLNSDSMELEATSQDEVGLTAQTQTLDGNLSWLLNYRIEELPPVPEADVPIITQPASNISIVRNIKTKNNVQLVWDRADKKIMKSDLPTQQFDVNGVRKPPFTYTELIEHALNECGKLTVSGIYHWISERFAFYKSNDDRWKNSVRHNLSINPQFRKCGKPKHGAGHLWMVAIRDTQKSNLIKRRVAQYVHDYPTECNVPEESPSDEQELAMATDILNDMLGDVPNANVPTTNIILSIPTENIQQTSALDPVNVETPVETTEVPQQIEFENLIDSQSALADFLYTTDTRENLLGDSSGVGTDYFITDINPNALSLEIDHYADDDHINFTY